jgi:SAM-dependent methyltransferase
MPHSFKTTLRYACSDDLRRPHWKKVNQKFSYPHWFWSRVWEYPFASLYVPNNSRSVLDIGGTYPDFLFKLFPHALSVDARDLRREKVLNLHGSKWPNGRLALGNFYDLPYEDSSFDYTFSISAFEETPDPIRCIKEALRVAKHRSVITLDVSNLYGCSLHQFEELIQWLKPANTLKANVPLTSSFTGLTAFGIRPINSLPHTDIRVVGLIIDKIPENPKVSILIPHWNSSNLLKACISSIDRLDLPCNVEILVGDDGSCDNELSDASILKPVNPRIECFRVIPFCRTNASWDADVGQVLDFLSSQISLDSTFTLMLDADTLALNSDFLSLPIKLLQLTASSVVGMDSDLADSYRSEFKSILSSLGLPIGEAEKFKIVNNLYRFMFSADFKIASNAVGFSRGFPLCPARFSSSRIAQRCIDKVLSRLGLPPLDGNLHKGSDNGVRAMAFLALNHKSFASNIPITAYRAYASEAGGIVGQLIGSSLYHLALSTRALSLFRREIKDTTPEYMNLYDEFTSISSESLTRLASLDFYSSSGSPSYSSAKINENRKLFEKLLALIGGDCQVL